jgi:hypothetical protein
MRKKGRWGMGEFKGYKGPYTLGSIQVNNRNAIGQNIDANNNGIESFATFWLWNRIPCEMEQATMGVMMAGPELLEALQELLGHAPSLEDLGDGAYDTSFRASIEQAHKAINKALTTPQTGV